MQQFKTSTVYQLSILNSSRVVSEFVEIYSICLCMGPFSFDSAQDEGGSLYSGCPPPGVLCSLRDRQTMADRW